MSTLTPRSEDSLKTATTVTGNEESLKVKTSKERLSVVKSLEEDEIPHSPHCTVVPEPSEEYQLPPEPASLTERIESAVKNAQKELQSSFEAKQRDVLLDETLRFAALEKQKQRVLTELSHYQEQHAEAILEVGRLKDARRALRRSIYERDTELLALKAQVADLEKILHVRHAKEVQLCAALRASRMEHHQMAEHQKSLEADKAALWESAQKVPTLETTIQSLESALVQEQSLRTSDHENYKKEVNRLDDLVGDMRHKMTDYRQKYMNLQFESKSAFVDEYRAGMNEELKQGGAGGDGVTHTDELWARIKVQEKQVTQLFDENFQLKLRIEQVRWYSDEEKVRLDAQINALRVELQRSRREVARLRPEPLPSEGPPTLTSQASLFAKPSTAPAGMSRSGEGAAGAQGSPPSSSAQQMPEAGPYRFKHLSTTLPGQEREEARLAMRAVTDGAAAVLGYVNGGGTWHRPGRWGDAPALSAAGPGPSGWHGTAPAGISRSALLRGHLKSKQQKARIPYDPNFPEEGGVLDTVEVHGHERLVEPMHIPVPTPEQFDNPAALRRYQQAGHDKVQGFRLQIPRDKNKKGRKLPDALQALIGP